jgi:hypothetical protein
MEVNTMSSGALSKNLFLGAVGLSFLLSVFIWFGIGAHDQALFVGLWVPSILGLKSVVQTDAREGAA